MAKILGLVFGGILMLIVAPVRAEDYIDAVKKGNEAYSNKDYKAALEQYHIAEPDIPSSPELDYNIGGALYQQGSYEEAVDKYTKALNTTDPDVQERAQYNLGNTYFQSKDYVKAIESYQEALKLNPDDMDAKFNLELARKMLKENAKQEKQEGQQQQQQQKQEQQNQDEKQKPEEEPPKQDEGKQDKDKQNQDQEQKNQQSMGAQPDSTQDMQQSEGKQAQMDEQQKMSKEDAERILNALRDDERNLQKRIRRSDQQKSEYTGKDW